MIDTHLLYIIIDQFIEQYQGFTLHKHLDYDKTKINGQDLKVGIEFNPGTRFTNNRCVAIKCGYMGNSIPIIYERTFNVADETRTLDMAYIMCRGALYNRGIGLHFRFVSCNKHTSLVNRTIRATMLSLNSESTTYDLDYLIMKSQSDDEIIYYKSVINQLRDLDIEGLIKASTEGAMLYFAKRKVITNTGFPSGEK